MQVGEEEEGDRHRREAVGLDLSPGLCAWETRRAAAGVGSDVHEPSVRPMRCRDARSLVG